MNRATRSPCRSQHGEGLRRVLHGLRRPLPPRQGGGPPLRRHEPGRLPARARPDRGHARRARPRPGPRPRPARGRRRLRPARRRRARRGGRSTPGPTCRCCAATSSRRTTSSSRWRRAPSPRGVEHSSARSSTPSSATQMGAGEHERLHGLAEYLVAAHPAIVSPTPAFCGCSAAEYNAPTGPAERSESDHEAQVSRSLPACTAHGMRPVITIARPAAAHCDTMDGPVVVDARTALEQGDVTPVLRWVRAEDEAEIRAAFDADPLGAGPRSARRASSPTARSSRPWCGSTAPARGAVHRAQAGRHGGRPRGPPRRPGARDRLARAARRALAAHLRSSSSSAGTGGCEAQPTPTTASTPGGPTSPPTSTSCTSPKACTRRSSPGRARPEEAATAGEQPDRLPA